jgi:hypothetical protein
MPGSSVQAFSINAKSRYTLNTNPQFTKTMSAIVKIISAIKNTPDATELKTLVFAIDLFNKVLPKSLNNVQIQRSLLADTIYFRIQCRLDEISDCKNLYKLEELYFSLSIPKEFLR